jgi:MFS family permease
VRVTRYESAHTAAPPPVPDPNRWKALALVCVAFFIVVLDVSIVNVALPSIQTGLDFSQDTLQWIITAYSLAFGGFLLLGGRGDAWAFWVICAFAVAGALISTAM